VTPTEATPAPNPASVAAPPASPDVHLNRIREIKSLVNQKVGNPVNLVDINNEVGREYMGALLDAMKKINSGVSAVSAMQRLETAYQAVEQTIKEHAANASSTVAASPANVSNEPSTTPQPAVSPATPPLSHPTQATMSDSSAESGAAEPSTSEPHPQTPTPHVQSSAPAAPGVLQSPTRQTDRSPTAHVPTKSDEPVSPLPNAQPIPPASESLHVDTPKPKPATTTPPAPSESEAAPNPAEPVAGQVPLNKSDNVTDTNQSPDEERWANQSLSTPKSQGVSTIKDMADTTGSEVVAAAAATTQMADPLYTPEIDAGLDQLLSEWSLFKKSGLFGTGPKGREHPLFKKIAGLQIPLLLAGRFEGATQEIKQSITDYMNGWRYEQGIVYNQGETFERYLRRVIKHILDLQKRKIPA
jgi:hypothetical protein